MTRPIFEPSLQRTDARLNYGQEQLFRRPAPTAAATGATVEWVTLTTTTNWGTSPTVLDFTIAGGDYDLVTPTFDLNSGNLEFNKPGAYDIHLYCVQVAVDGSGTVWSHVSIEFDKVGSGPNGGGPHGWTVGTAYSWLKLYYVPNSPLVSSEGDPHLQTFVYWDSGDFVGTPFELQVTAVKYYDGVETAETSAINRMLVVRVGDPYT